MKRKGFTLIELLVVIAIIGILAAMLFPVFARARESARKTQCLANVKNIAIALNMYLVDWEQPMPYAAIKEAYEYFNSFNPTAYQYPDSNCNRAYKGNPYLREAVILEDYVKNRDVWKCPSSKVMQGASIILPVGRNGLWINNWIDHGPYWHDDGYVDGILPCNYPFPSGWGGEVTDSWVQGLAATDMKESIGRAGSGVFLQGIGINDAFHWRSFKSVQDPAKFVACGDVGTFPLMWDGTHAAFPDLFCAGGCGTDPGCCGTADWANCNWSTNCGLDWDSKTRIHQDANYQKSWARHLGGSNLGFLDGHAKWYPYKVLLTQVESCCPADHPNPNPVIEGLANDIWKWQ